MANSLAEIQFPKLGKSPPEKILLLQWGLNQTQAGPVFLTKDSANEIMKRYLKNGVIKVVDIDHQSMNSKAPREERGAIAHSKLDLDPQCGIWAINQWTEDGDKLVRSGKFTYFSPSVNQTETGEAVEINSWAITNYPRMQNIKPLLLSQQGMFMDELSKMPSETLMTTIRPLRLLYNTTSELMSAVQGCIRSFSEGPINELSQNILSTLPSWVSTMGTLLEEMDPHGETEMKDEFEKKKEESQSEKITMQAKDGMSDEEMKKKGKEMRSDYSALYDFCKTLTGKDDVDEIQGYLRAQKANVNVMKEQVVTGEKEQVVQMVHQGIKDGLIPPSEKEEYLKCSKKEITVFLSNAMPMPEMLFQSSLPKELTPPSKQVEKQYEDDVAEILKQAARR